MARSWPPWRGAPERTWLAAPDLRVFHAIRPMAPTEWLRETLAVGGLPAALRRAPALRDGLVLGVALRRSHLLAPVALAGAAAARRRPAALTLVLPWLAELALEQSERDGGRTRALARLPLRATRDLLEVARARRGQREGAHAVSVDGGGGGPLRVALLLPSFWPEVRRGAERMARDLADDLLARGHRPRLVTSHPAPPRRDVEDGLPITRHWRAPEGWLRRRGWLEYMTHVPFEAADLAAGDDDVVQPALRDRRPGGGVAHPAAPARRRSSPTWASHVGRAWSTAVGAWP